ncbi:ABC transporter substrate-binding protein [Arthrobacter sp. B0490]|uniref:ABC transporter substrate-binding protein n=1 Tax=Arthrobacter sp. B0490 TaxID=2058891 RepID=UPI000CE2DFFC|nr:extracellular solute-binding protein [Arthrobacter sp. B0490]
MFRTLSRRTLTGVAALAAAGLALTGCGGGGGEPAAVDTEEQITLNYTFWGNDDRAARYDEAITAFEEKYPNITINDTFTDYPSYWEKRQTEAAGGGLPDVMQFDYTYLRQYGDNGLLLNLEEYFGNGITTDAIDESLLSTGKLEDGTFAIPTGYSAWSVFQNPGLLAEAGVEPYAGGTSWEEYDTYMASVTDASGGTVYGGTDTTQRIQDLELKLRQDGRQLFTDEGELNFTQEELAEHWQEGQANRDKVTVPQSKLEEINPVSGFGGNLTTSEMSWSNFLGGYLGDSGAEEITIVAPPTSNPDEKDLYRKVGLMQAASSSTEHPEAAAAFVDFLINSPEVGGIFGATLGIPASETQLEGANLEGPDKAVQDYLDSIADRLGEAPAAPVAGFGAIEQTFWDLGKSIGLGTVTPEEAAQQFFDEAAVTLGS